MQLKRHISVWKVLFSQAESPWSSSVLKSSLSKVLSDDVLISLCLCGCDQGLKVHWFLRKHFGLMAKLLGNHLPPSSCTNTNIHLLCSAFPLFLQLQEPLQPTAQLLQFVCAWETPLEVKRHRSGRQVLSVDV